MPLPPVGTVAEARGATAAGVIAAHRFVEQKREREHDLWSRWETATTGAITMPASELRQLEDALSFAEEETDRAVSLLLDEIRFARRQAVRATARYTYLELTA